MRRVKAGTPATAYRRAVSRLARRDHTVAELRGALLDAGHAEAEVEQAIERLRRERALDDAGYAERFARSRLSQHGLGRSRIRQALRRRGVGRAETEAGIRTAVRDVDEDAVLDALARRYWAQHVRLEPARRLPRLWVFLVRRGFAPALVRQRLGALWPRWADALAGLEPAEAADDDGDPGQQEAACGRPGEEH